MTLTNLRSDYVWKLLCKFEFFIFIGSREEDILNMFPI
jgi:hypothetical protein